MGGGGNGGRGEWGRGEWGRGEWGRGEGGGGWPPHAGNQPPIYRDGFRDALALALALALAFAVVRSSSFCCPCRPCRQPVLGARLEVSLHGLEAGLGRETREGLLRRTVAGPCLLRACWERARPGQRAAAFRRSRVPAAARHR